MPVVKDDVRKLATVEELVNIRPIEGADAIVAANVRGWTVVVKKGEFQEGDRVVYFEVDTALPLEDARFAFLEPRGVKEVEGVKYHVLKTARLRGVYSQGLVMPLEAFWEDLEGFFPGMERGVTPALGVDVTSSLNLGKWEAPLPVGSGDTAGSFLTQYARKTDSERVQNLQAVWGEVKAVEWEASEKVDGTSCTVVRDEEGRLRVMGRNWELREGDNTYWNVVNHYKALMDTIPVGGGLQVEIAGPGIQRNPLKLQDVRPFVFDVIAPGKRMVPRSEWPQEVLKWAVPLVDLPLPATAQELVEQVDGMKSLVNPQVLAEGVVFHTKDGRVVPAVGDRNTFKVISGKFLLKHQD